MIQEYNEILLLTKQYLLQEHGSNELLFTDQETYLEMRAFAQSLGKPKKLQSPPPPAPRPMLKPAAPSRKSPARIPHPIQPEQNQTEKVTHKIERQTVSVEQKDDFTDIRKIIREKHPKLLLSDTIPGDAKSREISHQWKSRERKPRVFLLVFDDIPLHVQFLQRLAAAIEDNFLPAKVVTLEELKLFPAEDQLLVIGEEKKIWKDIQLETSSVVYLAEIREYLRDPKLKAPLWKEICGRLKELNR